MTGREIHFNNTFFVWLSPKMRSIHVMRVPSLELSSYVHDKISAEVLSQLRDGLSAGKALPNEAQ
jgi:hypothetical protein